MKLFASATHGAANIGQVSSTTKFIGVANGNKVIFKFYMQHFFSLWKCLKIKHYL